jgi:uncharacterized protein (TIGR03435 family)
MKGILLTVVTLQFALGQTSPSKPEFEVAAIKLCNGNGRGGTQPAPGRLNMGCQSVHDLIQIAYGVFSGGTNKASNISLRRIQVIGARGWVASEMYEVNAKAEDGAGVGQMLGPMLQLLLENRFQFKMRPEIREIPIYELTVAKGGAKLQPLKDGACEPIDLDHLPPAPAPGKPMPNFCGRQVMRMNGPLQTEVHGMTLANFAASMLSDRLDRPVFDRTGLSEFFDIHLEFAPDHSMVGAASRGGQENSDAGAGSPADTLGPSIFTAIQEQLGLKLSAANGPVEVLVVDHVERPSAN